MRLVSLVPLALIACSGGTTATPEEPAPAPVAEPAAPAPAAPIREQTLLERPAPEPGPNTRAMAALTKELGVGMVRCPLAGGGKAHLRHGTPRDSLLYWGVLLSMEIDQATDAPWNTVYDTVRSEDDWVAIPVAAGVTRSWVDAANRTLELDHPAVGAGETANCTAVREVGTRVVKGSVTGEIPANTHFVPCMKESPTIGADGTFVLDVPVPCTGWLEGSGQRSEKLRIDPGDGPVEHTFAMTPDTLQLPDRSWTPEGLEAASKAIARLQRGREQGVVILDRVKDDLKVDAEAAETLSVWKTGLWEQKLLLERATSALKESTP
ncbi:MAG: hypothetical protein KC621_06950 [Myxococcales bacterium]|nr:hypothetical protein [Myxococcales bacterium]